MEEAAPCGMGPVKKAQSPIRRAALYRPYPGEGQKYKLEAVDEPWKVEAPGEESLLIFPVEDAAAVSAVFRDV